MGNRAYWRDRASIFSTSAAAISPPTKPSSGCPDFDRWSTTLTCSSPLTTPTMTRRCSARAACFRDFPNSHRSTRDSGAPPRRVEERKAWGSGHRRWELLEWFFGSGDRSDLKGLQFRIVKRWGSRPRGFGLSPFGSGRVWSLMMHIFTSDDF